MDAVTELPCYYTNGRVIVEMSINEYTEIKQILSKTIRDRERAREYRSSTRTNNRRVKDLMLGELVAV